MNSKANNGITIENLQQDKEDLTLQINSLKNELQEKEHQIENLKHENYIIMASIGLELKTPLTAIIGFTETLIDELSVTTPQKQNLNTIIKNSYHLSNLLNCILDLAKIDNSQLQINHTHFQLNELIKDIENLIHFQADSSKINITIKCEYPLPTIINNDPVRLKQVLINLCNNAIKFTKEGDITLNISYRREKHRLRFTVTDTGIGISNNHLKHIFQPFRQANNLIQKTYGGSGLGLYLSSQIAKLLGGSLTVDSELTKGSTFTFDIDPGHIEEDQFVWSEFEINKNAGITSSQSNYKLTGNILLAEDNVDNQKLTSLLVSKTGAQMVIVENGLEAIQQVQNSSFDLVLMDIHMPKLDGMGAVKKIREFNLTIPIVAITADNSPEEINYYLENGFDDVIKKPIDRNHLFEILNNTLKHDRFSKAANSLTEIENTLKKDPEYQLLVQSFNDNLIFHGQQIKEAITQKDWDKLRAESHKLKGTAASFGYPEISRTASNVERMIKNNQIVDAIDIAESLYHQCQNSQTK